MKRRPAFMEGYTEFYPYCYLLIAADNSLEAAKLVEKYDHNRGRNYHYASAVIFSAFAVEAVVNHIGLEQIEDWAKDERKKGGWEKKLIEVAALGSKTPDFTEPPFKTAKEAFSMRDRLAHGKTWVGEQCYIDTGCEQEEHSFPDWLELYLNERKAVEVVSDARKVVETLLLWARYPLHDLYCMGRGHYSETANAQPRAAVWKVKNS
ncbi:MAG: hypothetical protein R3B84_12130 [Zavarzinella sp.]